MRALHVVKTASGAHWAASLAEILVRLGVEVHVAVPDWAGAAIPLWRKAARAIHVVNLDMSTARPWAIPAMCAAARRLVEDVRPDIIHSHFVGTTLLLRLALGGKHPVPRIFQVPGPLHLKHFAPRRLEIGSSAANDYWIGSSRCIVRHYLRAGIDPARVFCSYYGVPIHPGRRTGYLRERLGIAQNTKIVGNINLIYPPKRYLGQHVGLKCHEDVIDALGIVLRERNDVAGVLIGATAGTAGTRYEDELRRRAAYVGRGRIFMPGYFGPEEVQRSWPDFDCAVHVPITENCGGVVEPLMAGVPVIASQTGGIPELVIDGVTGLSVPVRDPDALGHAVLRVLNNPGDSKRMAAAGQRLVRATFDFERTGTEVAHIYRHILEGAPRPPDFSPQCVLDPTPGAVSTPAMTAL